MRLRPRHATDPRRRWGARTIGVVTTLLLAVGTLGVGQASADPSGPASTTISVSVSPEGAARGETVTLTAQVTSDGAPVTVGRVAFEVAKSVDVLGDVTEETGWLFAPVALNGAGVATLSLTLDQTTLPFLTSGSFVVVQGFYEPYDVTDSVAYDEQFTDSVSEPVRGGDPSSTAAETITALSAAPASVDLGDETTLTASVSARGVAVTRGRVSFKVAPSILALKTSSVTVATVALNAQGMASYTLEVNATTLPFVAENPAVHVMAVYEPYDGTTLIDEVYSPSSSQGHLLLDSAADAQETVTTLALSPADAAIGDEATLTATVTAEGVPVTQGSVEFNAAATVSSLWGLDESDTVDATDVSLGTVSLTAAGTATLTVALTPEVLEFVTMSVQTVVFAAKYEPKAGEQSFEALFRPSDSAAVVLGAVTPEQPSVHATTTSLTLPTASVQMGSSLTLSAQVSTSPGTVSSGRVSFKVSDTAEGVWAQVSATTLGFGPVNLDASGNASYQLTVNEETLPFLATGSTLYVAATFIPGDPVGGHSYAMSSSSTVSATVTRTVATQTTVAFPADRNMLGNQIQVTAQTRAGSDPVSSGTVTFIAAATEAALADEGAGTARVTSAPIAVTASGTATYSMTIPASLYVPITTDQVTLYVMAVFTPAANSGVTASRSGVASLPLDVPVRRAVHAAFTNYYLSGSRLEVEVVITPAEAEGSVTCQATWGETGSVTSSSQGRYRCTLLKYVPAAYSMTVTFTPTDPLRYSSATASINHMPSSSEVNDTSGQGLQIGRPLDGQQVRSVTQAEIIGGARGGSDGTLNLPPGDVPSLTVPATFAAGTAAYNVNAPGKYRMTAQMVVTGGALRSAAVGSGSSSKRTVACPAAPGGGYVCQLGFLPAGTRVQVTPVVRVPASEAGRKIAFSASVTLRDITTGKISTIARATKTVVVPKKTALGVSLATVTKVSSLKPKKSTKLKVGFVNGGIITATKVRACVTVSKGAKIVRAKGAKVKGTSACWTLAKMKRGAKVKKVITVRAPAKKGTMRIDAALTPKSTQADKVSVTGLLSVK